MKMQSASATQWLNRLPPVLARVFAGSRREEQTAEATEEINEAEFSHSRWSWEENSETSANQPKKSFTKRPEIMVPVDFSASSEAAVDYSIKVARRARARLVLLHAVYLNLTPYGPANPAWLRSALCREALQKMEGIMARARRENVPAISVIEEGAPTQVIARAAKRWQADLIVMASGERSGWSRFFGRQILEKVTREAECPVMVIHRDARKGAVV